MYHWPFHFWEKVGGQMPTLPTQQYHPWIVLKWDINLWWFSTYYLTCTTVHTLILHFTRASGYGSAIAGTDSSGRWAVAKPKPDVRAARKDCPIRTILLMTTFQGHFAVHCWNVNKRTNRSQWPYDIFLRTCFFPNFLQTNFFLDAPYWFYPYKGEGTGNKV